MSRVVHQPFERKGTAHGRRAPHWSPRQTVRPRASTCLGSARWPRCWASLGLAPGAPGAGAPAFPVTLVDDEGTEVTLEAEPQRIISLSPANTEIVFALGAGDRLVGGTDYDDYPAEAAALPDVATFQGVVMEQVVELEPDLVLAAGNAFTPPDDIARMRELGYPVLVVYAPTCPRCWRTSSSSARPSAKPTPPTAMTEEMARQLDAVARPPRRRRAARRARTTSWTGSRARRMGPRRTRSWPTWSSSPAASPSRPGIRPRSRCPSSGSSRPTRRSSSWATPSTASVPRTSPRDPAGTDVSAVVGRGHPAGRRRARHAARTAPAAGPRRPSPGPSIPTSSCPASRPTRRSAWRLT